MKHWSAPKLSLPGDLQAKVARAALDWEAGENTRRLWERDATLWTGADEAAWLGWLDITRVQLSRLEVLQEFAAEIKRDGFRHALLLGMGGSSLCPEVLSLTFRRDAGRSDAGRRDADGRDAGRSDAGRRDAAGENPGAEKSGEVKGGFPELLVLDSTDPMQVRSLEDRIDPTRTLFIVSSKSGSTLEPNIFEQYFFDRAQKRMDPAQAAQHFVAITDPGSKLEQTAKRKGFRRIFHGDPSIGGRYSALSDFGLVPASILGLDLRRFLERTEAMVRACRPGTPAEMNPGVLLGLILGEAGRQGRDKLTLVASPGIRAVGAWLEQLVAESTGKAGKGLIPVDLEPEASPDRYGQDRIFVYLRLEQEPDPRQDAFIESLVRAGHPVVQLSVDEPIDLGAEFFRWEIATAVAGSVLGINPFDQPDVEASKLATRRLTDEYERTGSLPALDPFFRSKEISLFAGPDYSRDLQASAGGAITLASLLRAHLDRWRAGDYVALLAYVEMNESHQRTLQAIRKLVVGRKGAATCLGFGPRFLHSTGQAYKGGPNTGIFLQITCADARDLPVPGQKYTFGVVKAAQARGDFEVLVERGRRALRVDLGPNVAAGLEILHRAVEEAML